MIQERKKRCAFRWRSRAFLTPELPMNAGSGIQMELRAFLAKLNQVSESPGLPRRSDGETASLREG